MNVARGREKETGGDVDFSCRNGIRRSRSWRLLLLQMDFFDEGGRGRDGAGGGDDRIVNAARAQTLRYSNFLLTISTNVRPRDEEERDALVEWLLNHLGELFGDFDLMNGNVLKPPGTANGDMARFPADNKIIKITNKNY